MCSTPRRFALPRTWRSRIGSAGAMGVNYPVVIGRWEIETAFSEVLALPTTYLVDRSGRVVAHYVGQFDAKSFERDVQRLVADRPVARAEVRSVDALTYR